MNYQQMNPGIDMDDLYKLSQGKETVVIDLTQHFRGAASLFPYPVKDETTKAFVTKALALGFRYKSIKRSIDLIPEQFEKFPSYVQFIDLVRSQSRTLNKMSIVKRETFLDDIQKDVNALVEFIGKDRVLSFAKAYLKNVFDITNIDHDLEGCAIALAVHDWKKCGNTKNLDDVWDYGIRTAEEARIEARSKVNDEIQRIINRVEKF